MPSFFEKIEDYRYIGRAIVKRPGAYKPLIISVN